MHNAQLSVLNAAMNTAGAKYPAPVAKAITDRDALREAVQDMPPVTRHDVTAAAADALLDGRDPLSDDAVLRLTLAHVMTGDVFNLEQTMTQHANDRIVTAMKDHAPAMVDTLRKAATQPAAELADAVELFGDLSLDDSDRILTLGPAAAEAWAKAKRAVKAIHTLDAGWVALANLTAFANPGTLKVYRLADVDLETWLKVGNAPDPWALVQAGATIDLATADTARERETRLSEARQSAGRVPREAFSNAFQRAHGFTPA